MKKKIVLAIILMWFVYVIAAPEATVSAAGDGLMLWYHEILPALFPYSLLAGLVLATHLFDELADSRRLKSLRLPILPQELFVMLCGFLFGFPIGSKLASDLCRAGMISERRAQLLCACTNNMSPAFVVSYVLLSRLRLSGMTAVTFLILYGMPLLFCVAGLFAEHLANGLTTACAAGRSDRGSSPAGQKKTASRFHIDMQIVDAGITDSFGTLIRLCGYIVMFSILARMVIDLRLPFESVKLTLIGLLEVTNGVSYLAESTLSDPVRYVCAIAFLSFGGISGIAQTGSVISQSRLKLSVYIRQKCILTLLTTACAIGYVMLCAPFTR